MKRSVFAALLLVAGCSSANQQTWFVTTAPDGTLIHHYTGYTNLGETAPGSSRKYLVQFLEEQCGGPGRVTRLDEWESHNGFGKFIYWAGEGQCINR